MAIRTEAAAILSNDNSLNQLLNKCCNKMCIRDRSTSIEQPDYITTIFNDDSVIEINIEMDEDSWQEMLDNAASEEYTAANITVNGTTYNNVAIRPKAVSYTHLTTYKPFCYRIYIKRYFFCSHVFHYNLNIIFIFKNIYKHS